MEIWRVWNKTTSILFEDEKDARAYAGSSSIATGLSVSRVYVIPSSKEPPNEAIGADYGKF